MLLLLRLGLVLVLLALFETTQQTNHQEAIEGMVDNNCPDLRGLTPLSKAVVMEEGYCAFMFAYGLRNPRGMINVNDHLVFIEQGTQAISYFNLSFENDDFTPISSRETLFRGHGLNHGIVFDDENNKIYASSAQAVYRWGLDPETMTLDEDSAEMVITNMPRGGHPTRTLLMDKDQNLFMSIGSGSNLDSDSSRSRVMKYEAQAITSFIEWDDTTKSGVDVFADGLRNEVGLAMDPKGRVWGVENGVDNLARTDLGGDIHSNNPGEELNLLEEGVFYGYPYCWSEYDLASYNSDWDVQQTRQWAQPEFPQYNDERCRADSRPPKQVAQAHMAPLGITFKDEDTAFVCFHGSWNREPAVGYRVDMYDFSDFNSYHDSKKRDNDNVDGGQGDENLVKSRALFAYGASVAFDRSWVRPVDPVMGPCPYFGECLYFTDDYAGTIIAIGRDPAFGPAFEYPQN